MLSVGFHPSLRLKKNMPPRYRIILVIGICSSLQQVECLSSQLFRYEKRRFVPIPSPVRLCMLLSQYEKARQVAGLSVGGLQNITSGSAGLAYRHVGHLDRGSAFAGLVSGYDHPVVRLDRPVCHPGSVGRLGSG